MVSSRRPKELIDGGIEEQTTVPVHLAQSILARQGCTLSDVAQTIIYLADINDLPKVNEIYRQYFVLPAPGRAAVEVSISTPCAHRNGLYCLVVKLLLS